MWSLQRTAVADMAADKEIPTDLEAFETLIGSKAPGVAPKLTPVEALMASPYDTQEPYSEAFFEVKEAVIDCLETLTEQDQFIINAIAYEGISYRELSERLGVSITHAWRLYQDAIANLGQIVMMDERITSRFETGDDNG